MKTHAALLLPLALAACSLRPHEFGDSATATNSASATSTGTTDGDTGLPPTTAGPGTTSTSPATTGDATGDSAGGFIPPQPDGGGSSECDPWTENCPEGQKCMPYSGDGDNAWESLKCVDIVPDPDAVGEPCMVFGSPVSGEDTCDKHAMCWYVDPDTQMGTCLAMCVGSPEAPSCEPPNTSCPIFSDGVLILCTPNCDPLLQDCLNGEVCVPHHAQGFQCLVDFSGDEGQVFDPCKYAGACDPGLYCADPALASECDPMASCCLPFCDLAQPGTCPGQDQECLAWFEEGLAPPGYEDVGHCAILPP